MSEDQEDKSEVINMGPINNGSQETRQDGNNITKMICKVRNLRLAYLERDGLSEEDIEYVKLTESTIEYVRQLLLENDVDAQREVIKAFKSAEFDINDLLSIGFNRDEIRRLYDIEGR